MTKPDASLRERWHEEKTSAWLYGAAAERDRVRADMFLNLGREAEKQAGILAGDMGETPPFVPGTRARVVATLVRALGPRMLKSVLAASATLPRKPRNWR